MTIPLVLAFALLAGIPVSLSATGQVATSAASAGVAINPLYTAPAASLATDQIAAMQQQLADWPQLSRYRADNAQLAPPEPSHARVVFYGDSITDAWGRAKGTNFFPGKAYVNRGVSGQTTAQMLLRFRQDVINLHPAAVLILAGTNDIAGNTGLATLPMIEDNLRSMTELAQANHIRVILASVLPVSDYPWHPGLQPAGKVRALNAWLESYAVSHGAIYLDYYSPLTNAQGGMDSRFASDGVHPTPSGYAVMAPLAEHAIERALMHFPPCLPTRLKPIWKRRSEAATPGHAPFEVTWGGLLPATGESVSHYLLAHATSLSINTLRQQVMTQKRLLPTSIRIADKHGVGCPY